MGEILRWNSEKLIFEFFLNVHFCKTSKNQKIQQTAHVNFIEFAKFKALGKESTQTHNRILICVSFSITNSQLENERGEVLRK